MVCKYIYGRKWLPQPLENQLKTTQIENDWASLFFFSSVTAKYKNRNKAANNDLSCLLHVSIEYLSL